MPTYEYACKACGEHFEVVQSFTDDALTKCPNCKKKQLRKVFGSIGITFKGSGFYKTDSRGGSSSTSSGSSDTKIETKSTETKTSETKTESKPSEKKSDSTSKSSSKSSTSAA